jgi:serine-type D-Ala-D-Ala carboxypeptidase (penicillin-binding protein 5/6)
MFSLLKQPKARRMFRGLYPNIFLVFLFLCSQPILKAQDISEVQAKSFLLVDAATGEVLYQRNANQTYAPASTVKLMTSLLVWERTGLEGLIQVNREDTQVEPSHIPLQVGETVSVREMTNALLIGSDNDSAMVLARAAGGSLSSFVNLMNSRARALGCRNTVFKNPHGLPAPGQVTTASDLMKIFQKVLSVSELRRICTTKSYRLCTGIGTQNIRNHNKLLGVYSGMGPAKTGWTYASRHTYAAAAIRNGRELHLIILNSANKWADARLIFDRGFAKPSIRKEPSDVILAQQPDSQPLLQQNVSTQTVAATVQPKTSARLIPSATSAQPSDLPATVNPSSLTTHTVRKGETLFSIGKSYGVNIPKILRYNALINPNQIYPGLVLFIPAGPAT